MSKISVTRDDLSKINTTLYGLDRKDDQRGDYLREQGGVEGIADALGTDLDRGLRDSEIEDRRALFGTNGTALPICDVMESIDPLTHLYSSSFFFFFFFTRHSVSKAQEGHLHPYCMGSSPGHHYSHFAGRSIHS